LTEPLSFWSFLRKFVRNIWALIGGALSVPLTIAAIFWPQAPMRVLFVSLAAIAALSACYLVWRDSLNDTYAEIRRLRAFDEEQKRLAEQTLKALPDPTVDAVCFLLRYGETEIEELRRHCKTPATFADVLQRAHESGLSVSNQYPIPGRAGIKIAYQVNPKFEAALRYLLGRRQMQFFQ
jgi:hypothetical protein